MNKISAITALLCALLYSCSAGEVRTIDALEAGISNAAASLEKGDDYRKLEKYSRHGKGYYYILNRHGIIIYHPEKGLIGSDFSRYGFVKKILRDKNGCIRSEAGAVSRIVLFREKGAEEILCYTIPANVINGAEKCEKYRE